MKKIVIFILALALVMSISVPALARGHHGGAKAVNYAVCTVENCQLAGIHAHGRASYAAHYYGDGHDYHGYCDVQNCTLAGYHAHDGEYCFARAANSGNRLNQGYGRGCCTSFYEAVPN